MFQSAQRLGRSNRRSEKTAIVEVMEARLLLTAAPTLTDIADFSALTGNNPFAGVVLDSQGTVYGTTRSGGQFGDGGVYKITPASGTVTSLGFFNGTNGKNPSGNLVMDSSGNLFGTTLQGGANNVGTIFKISAGSNSISTVASFSTATSGSGPAGNLAIDSSGNLYGTTAGGGSHGDGTLFELPVGSNTILPIQYFNGANGIRPFGVITDPSGNLYGTIGTGGSNGQGFIYELTGSLNALVSFNTSVGTNPGQGLLRDQAGNLFGTTTGGGTSGDGTIFEFQPGVGLTSLASFNAETGYGAVGNLIEDTAGDLFGTTSSGGSANDGTVFELPAGASTITPLVSFTGTNGSTPLSGLTMDANGNLYGTTSTGGANNVGDVFEVSFAPVAAKVVVTRQPLAPVTAGASQKFTVSLESAHGLIDTTNNSTVTLSIESGPSGASLQGTLSAVAVNGVADFSDIAFDTTGIYVLQASSSGLSSGMSSSVWVDAAAASQLVFLQPPSNAVAGGSLGTVIVGVEDAFGNIVTTDSSTLSLSTNDSTTLNGTTSVTTVAGLASFQDLSLVQAGVHSLVADDGNLPQITSAPSVTFPASANMLVIIQQPSTGTFGETIGPVTVEVEDGFGNLVSTDGSDVTLTGDGLSGVTTVAAQGGVATFSNLTINANGSEVITAKDPGLTSATSTPIVISNTAAAGANFAPLSIDPSTLFPKSNTGSKWLKVEVVKVSSGKVALTRTLYPKAGQTVTVSNLNVNASGLYNVVALDSLGHQATLEQVTVLPEAPHELWFSSQPAALDGTTSISVSVLDKNGNLTTGADGSTVVLHAWLPKNTPGPAPTLTGTVTAIVTNGVATFTGLMLNQPGRAHLIARLGNLKPTVSGVFAAVAGGLSEKSPIKSARKI